MAVVAAAAVRGSRGSRGRGGGRGRKSNATKAAEKAKLAAFLLKRFGADGSKMGATAADDVQCQGSQTWAERDAELRADAVDLDSEDEAIGGGRPACGFTAPVGFPAW